MIVLCCFMLDVLSRFIIPPRWIAFRAWEGMHSLATEGAFPPNAVYRNARSFGDLSNLGNLPRLRQYRQEVFSSDAAGFRNRHEAAKPFGGILLVGDSFAAGAGVSDEDTLTEDLARLSGLPVYNAAGASDALERVPMSCGLIIWEVSEREPLPQPLDQRTLDPQVTLGWKGKILVRLLGERRRQEFRSFWRLTTHYVSSWWVYSPVAIWSHRLIKAIQNDRILPNDEGYLVEIHTLVNGREMLFLPEEVSNYQTSDRSTDPRFFVQLRNHLKARGIELLVLLVPDKYVVYHDLLSPAPAAPPTPHGLFMDIVEQRLSSAGVPVVNLTPTFRAQAASQLARDSYLYWLDDSHWNAAGVHIAAVEILKSGVFPKAPCLSTGAGPGR
jgi:hypothetical protein